MSRTTFLVTGAGRGIGLGLVASLLLRPSSTNLPKGGGPKIIIVKIDSSGETDPAKAVSILQRDHSITALDVVIANAGIAHSSGPVIKTSTFAIRDHLAVNTIGPLLLFQATTPLLRARKTGRPVFVAVTSILAAMNWFIRRLHFEEMWLTSFLLHPGTVATDIVKSVTDGTDLKLEDLGAMAVEQSVSDLVQRVDTASRDVSGTFQNHGGTHLPW
ncbi:short-chain dehydrogenase [Colletotrichum filicis]|nr:short-chain dehydrogenase [Colletotrichum filicis]